MREGATRGAERRLTVVLLIIVLCVAVVDSALTLRLMDRVTKASTVVEELSSFPCAALPVSLVQEEPACVNKLLGWMNVTNVRVVENSSELPDMDPALRDRLRRLGFDPHRNMT